MTIRSLLHVPGHVPQKSMHILSLLQFAWHSATEQCFALKALIVGLSAALAPIGSAKAKIIAIVRRARRLNTAFSLQRRINDLGNYNPEIES
jgi:hypothetical protein